MILTPADSETRRCIYARGREDLRCASTRCMAWRWAEVPGDHPDAGKGFCGMAGNPPVHAGLERKPTPRKPHSMPGEHKRLNALLNPDTF